MKRLLREMARAGGDIDKKREEETAASRRGERETPLVVVVVLPLALSQRSSGYNTQ
jgi:hypothetical protein